MVRITRYASSNWSLVSSPVDGGATADMRLSSLRLLLVKLLLRRLQAGCAHDGVDVDAVRTVGQRDRGEPVPPTRSISRSPSRAMQPGACTVTGPFSGSTCATSTGT